jgi:hypothetical protein
LDTLEETADLLLHDFTAIAIRGHGLYVYDSGSSDFSSDSENQTVAIWDAVHRAMQSASLHRESPQGQPLAAQVAVFIDDISTAHWPVGLRAQTAQDKDRGWPNLCLDVGPFASLPFPVRYHFMSDLLSSNFDAAPIKLAVLLNPLRVSKELAAVIKKKLHTDGKTVVYSVGAGVVDGEGKSTPDGGKELMGLAGLSAGQMNSQSRRTVFTAPKPGNENGLWPPTAAEAWAPLVGALAGTRYPSTPWQYVNRTGDDTVVLGFYEGTKLPSLIRTTFATHSVVFSANPGLPKAAWNAIAAAAGVHSYLVGQFDTMRVEAGGNLLVIHHAVKSQQTLRPGANCTVLLPRSATVSLANGSQVCERCTQFTDCEIERQTRVYVVSDTRSPARSPAVKTDEREHDSLNTVHEERLQKQVGYYWYYLVSNGTSGGYTNRTLASIPPAACTYVNIGSICQLDVMNVHGKLKSRVSDSKSCVRDTKLAVADARAAKKNLPYLRFRWQLFPSSSQSTLMAIFNSPAASASLVQELGYWVNTYSDVVDGFALDYYEVAPAKSRSARLRLSRGLSDFVCHLKAATGRGVNWWGGLTRIKIMVDVAAVRRCNGIDFIETGDYFNDYSVNNPHSFELKETTELVQTYGYRPQQLRLGVGMSAFSWMNTPQRVLSLCAYAERLGCCPGCSEDEGVHAAASNPQSHSSVGGHPFHAYLWSQIQVDIAAGRAVKGDSNRTRGSFGPVSSYWVFYPNRSSSANNRTGERTYWNDYPDLDQTTALVRERGLGGVFTWVATSDALDWRATRRLFRGLSKTDDHAFLHREPGAALLAAATLNAKLPGHTTTNVMLSLDRDCGGHGDGVMYNDEALDRCLARLRLSGGGVLYVPPGRWLASPFNISTSHVVLLLAGDATLVASPEPARWPLVLPYPSYGRCREYDSYLRYSAFISVVNASDVRITSNASHGSAPGTIFGHGQVWSQLHDSGELKHDPGALIETMYSDHVEIDSVHVHWAPYWHIHLFATAFVHIHDARISSDHAGWDTYGIDPSSSNNVLIERVNISTGDDCISVKSGWDLPGIEFAMPSFNIAVKDSILSTDANAFCVGSEMSGGVFNVTATNISCIDVGTCFRIKSALGRGGTVRNVWMINSTIDGAKTAIEASDFYSGHPEAPNPELVPTVEHCGVRGLHGRRVDAAGCFRGLPSRNLSALLLSDIVLAAPAGTWAPCNNVTGTSHNVTPAACSNFRPAVKSDDASPLDDPDGAATSRTELFVSVSGSDSSNGRSAATAFRSLTAARDAIRRLNASARCGDITVTIGAGDYAVVDGTGDLQLGSVDSGCGQGHITWAASTGAHVRVHGGLRIPNGAFSPMIVDGRRMLVADLRRSLNLTDFGHLNHAGKPLIGCVGGSQSELFYNDQPMTVARYPNLDATGNWRWLRTGTTVNTSTFATTSDEETQHAMAWANESNVWVHGYWSRDWADSYCESRPPCPPTLLQPDT